MPVGGQAPPVSPSTRESTGIQDWGYCSELQIGRVAELKGSKPSPLLPPV